MYRSAPGAARVHPRGRRPRPPPPARTRALEACAHRTHSARQLPAAPPGNVKAHEKKARRCEWVIRR